MNDEELTEEVELELPEEDYRKLVEQADAQGVSVDRMINDMLKQAIESGEFERLVDEIKKRG